MVAEALRDEAQRVAWRENGIEFGRCTDLYALPERAARCIADAATRTAAPRIVVNAGTNDDRHTVPA
jgi:hypothetical protein